MAGFALASLAAIAGSLFVAELTDKDALLILSFATRVSPWLVFLAGATAFVFTTALFVTAGAVLVAFVPVLYVKLAGGAVMLAYGAWTLFRVVTRGAAEEEERGGAGGTGPRAFAAMVGTLALLDIAGDATELLTIVFVAHYSSVLLVFVGACVGLISATALETALGNRLGHLLTPRRLGYGSAAVFLTLGAAIILASL